MIHGTYSVIRTAEPDDARDMLRLYRHEEPNAALLNRQRELVTPTADELREILAPKEQMPASFFAVEDLEGRVRGYLTMRGSMFHNLFYAEMVLLLHQTEDFWTPLAEEAFAWLRNRAFRESRLRKLIAHCLDNQTDYRQWLAAMGFVSNGIQREVLFARGRWHDSETLSLYNPDWA